MKDQPFEVIRDGTKKAYAAIDVAVFDPLMANDASLDRLAYALAGLSMPDRFYELFATHRLSVGRLGIFPETEAVARAKDAESPQRVFRNALLLSWQMHTKGATNTTEPSVDEASALRNEAPPYVSVLRNFGELKGNRNQNDASRLKSIKEIVGAALQELHKVFSYEFVAASDDQFVRLNECTAEAREERTSAGEKWFLPYQILRTYP